MEEHFEVFIQFFFEDIYNDIDFSRGFEPLTKELRKIGKDHNVGNRFADVLMKVYLKDGTEKYIFIHIEVQGNEEENFPERMYVYNYRIFDKSKDKKAGVVSLAILTDENSKYRPMEHSFSKWGFNLSMRFPIVKIIDFAADPALIGKLKASTNPMAMVVKAQLKSYEVRNVDVQRKYTIKWELMRQCVENKYQRKQTEGLFKFIDYIITLPKELENQLVEEIEKHQEEYQMPYVTSWERIGIEKGREEGRQEGRQEGRHEANLESARRMLNEGLSIPLISKCTGLTEEEIKRLLN